MAQDWTFTQLEGPRKTLVLTGKAAPHGRPRRAPVVKNKIKLRKERVHYPEGGRKAPPTTHVFGSMYEPWELKGRFMDKDLGPGAAAERRALAMSNAWRQFVDDACEVRITWGDILVATGLVDYFDGDHESEHEIAYTIGIEIDTQPLEASVVNTFAPSPEQICDELAREMADGLGKLPTTRDAGGMSPDFLETLEDLVSVANSFSASFLNIAGELDAFASGTIGQLERLRTGAAQFRTAIIRIRGTIETTENDLATLTSAGDADVQWFVQRANLDVSTLNILALLDELDREAEIAQSGQIATTVVARLGDSWEGLAGRFYGGPDGAGRIREANGVRYGELPVPGRTYQIPTAT